METALLRTPLWEEHRGLGGKLVSFNGWEMPLQYPGGILKEHDAVRAAAGLFDVSHMARFEVRGQGALEFVDGLITNDLQHLPVGRLLYSPMCREDGGVLDDVTVYRQETAILVVANAGNRERIWSWLVAQAEGWKGAPARLVDRSAELAQVALQGPRSQELLAPSAEGDLNAIPYYGFGRVALFGIADVLISRNGYTGEDGFEIYPPADRARELWRGILEAGRDIGALPTGLGCRDTLRMEMAYALYGNELDLGVHPLEARLGWTVKFKKPRFMGKGALEARRSAGLDRTLVGFEVEGNRFARKDQVLNRGGIPVGKVTSGGFSPTLKKGIGLGFVTPDLASVGSALEVDVRGESVRARVVELPFYTRGSHR